MLRVALLLLMFALPVASALAANCAEQAAEKKLAGAAKAGFVNKCVKDAVGQ